MEQPLKKCIECAGDMVKIQIIDHGQGGLHYNLNYTNDEFKKKPRKYNMDGFVSAEACQNCGRIVLRAVPKA